MPITLVTGASRGIGLATVRELAAATLFVCGGTSIGSANL